MSDADGCALHSDNCDRDHGFCSNTVGVWALECSTGWEFPQTKLLALGINFNDGKTCIDIEECARGTFDCDPNASYVNNAGSSTCECDARFTDDGQTCMDFDESSRLMLGGADAKSCDVNAFCTNSFGGYTCNCMTGYSQFMLNERRLYQHR